MHDAPHINGAREHSPGADMVGVFLIPAASRPVKSAASSRHKTTEPDQSSSSSSSALSDDLASAMRMSAMPSRRSTIR